MTQDPFGILVVDKEKGMTSHDVVELVRRRFGIKKVGHAGTLDPNATGVLVLLLGRATKLSAKFSAEEKEYRASMKLGEKTDSGDCEGSIISTRGVTSTQEEIKEVFRRFLGETEQTPPMVSAKRVGGRRLYKLARKGIEVERKPQKIVIKKLEVESVDLPLVRFQVVCSKGTYIRQLAEDIGKSLGCGAHLVELERVRSGDFSSCGALSVSRLKEMDKETFNESIIRI